jgi:hypothetical protein
MVLEKDTDYERYRRLRAVSTKINTELSRLLNKKEIYRCAKDLGRLKKNTLVLNNEDDLSTLMDYCIHNPSGKRSCIDGYIERSSFEPVSDEMMLLKALRESFFSILQVNSTEKGYLCHVDDILRKQNIILLDIGLGSSAPPGMLVAARLIKMPAAHYYMTTGAPMLIREPHAIGAVATTLRAFTRSIDSGYLSQTQANAIGKRVTRAVLRQENENSRLVAPEEVERVLHKSNSEG